VRDLVKAVASFIRWLAGLKPKNGRRYYFERYSIPKEVLEQLEPFRASGTCPFCGKTFRCATGFVSHIIRVHYSEVVELLQMRKKKRRRKNVFQSTGQRR
jgi:hypothetical protein